MFTKLIIKCNDEEILYIFMDDLYKQFNFLLESKYIKTCIELCDKTEECINNHTYTVYDKIILPFDRRLVTDFLNRNYSDCSNINFCDICKYLQLTDDLIRIMKNYIANEFAFSTSESENKFVNELNSMPSFYANALPNYKPLYYSKRANKFYFGNYYKDLVHLKKVLSSRVTHHSHGKFVGLFGFRLIGLNSLLSQQTFNKSQFIDLLDTAFSKEYVNVEINESKNVIYTYKDREILKIFFGKQPYCYTKKGVYVPSYAICNSEISFNDLVEIHDSSKTNYINDKYGNSRLALKICLNIWKSFSPDELDRYIVFNLFET